MNNREWLNNLNNRAMAEKILPPGCECEYCILNADCNHITGVCVNKLVEWLEQEHIEPMPKLRIGDVLRFKFKDGLLKYTGSVVGEGYMYSPESGYGLAEIDNSHYRILEVWRFDGKKLDVIWRTSDE